MRRFSLGLGGLRHFFWVACGVSRYAHECSPSGFSLSLSLSLPPSLPPMHTSHRNAQLVTSHQMVQAVPAGGCVLSQGVSQQQSKHHTIARCELRTSVFKGENHPNGYGSKTAGDLKTIPVNWEQLQKSSFQLSTCLNNFSAHDGLGCLREPLHPKATASTSH